MPTAASVSFRAWDQNGGQRPAGTKVDASTNGGTTAFSTATETASITVTAVNDAPTISNGATVVLAGTDEDTNVGRHDGRHDAHRGLVGRRRHRRAEGHRDHRHAAATARWQYSTDGLTWTAFGDGLRQQRAAAGLDDAGALRARRRERRDGEFQLRGVGPHERHGLDQRDAEHGEPGCRRRHERVLQPVGQRDDDGDRGQRRAGAGQRRRR